MSRDPTAYAQPDCASTYLAARLTILLTKHPTTTDPSMAYICSLFQSLHLSPSLRSCRKLVVFDGPKRGLEPERIQQYHQLMEAVEVPPLSVHPWSDCIDSI